MRLAHALLAAAAAFVLALPAAASLSVGGFLAKAHALHERGAAGLLTPDFQLVRGETQAAAAELSASESGRRSAGAAPLACVPHGEVLDVPDMLAGLAALSPAEKALPFRDGYALVLQRRFPCAPSPSGRGAAAGRGTSSAR